MADRPGQAGISGAPVTSAVTEAGMGLALGVLVGVVMLSMRLPIVGGLFVWPMLIMGIVRTCQRRRTAWFYWMGLAGVMVLIFILAAGMGLSRRP